MRQIKPVTKALALAGFLVLATASAAGMPGAAAEIGAPGEASALWQPAQVAQLRQWVARAPEDALPMPATSGLDAASAGGDPARLDSEANALALKLARLHLLGSIAPSGRVGWRIVDSDASIDLEARLHRALGRDGLDQFFSGLRPQNSQYAALRAALAGETDPARRRTIAGNMERWRWMAHDLGPNYVLVNAATFTAGLWRQGTPAGEWRVIVGKRSTPTPVFSATITGVIFNPWWEIPASIVREKRGNFPARLGYVRSGSRYRQKPGPNNALGQMKLVMPNPFNVYMHDTPGKQLFEKEERAFSHGCIRTGDAIGFASTLLEGVKTREEIDAILASGKTTQIDLPKSLPVYVTYFTASADSEGTVTIHKDIYKRDRAFTAAIKVKDECSV